ncbi:MAG: DUF805 domain-containing protein [Devosia sp.]|nr:DUF805 domain-containing protein [Devosia sp.]
MDKIVELYTKTEGRISRKTFWLGILGLVVVNLLIAFLILPLVGVSMMPSFAGLTDPSADAAAISKMIIDTMRASAWASLVLFVIFAYPAYALMVKRRHDKDNNGMDVLIYLGLTALLLVVQALGIGYDVTTIGEISVPTPSLILTLLSAVVGIYAIYLVVVLGFLRGTAGPNQYGPDPLGGTAAATA